MLSDPTEQAKKVMEKVPSDVLKQIIVDLPEHMLERIIEKAPKDVIAAIIDQLPRDLINNVLNQVFREEIINLTESKVYLKAFDCEELTIRTSGHLIDDELEDHIRATIDSCCQQNGHSCEIIFVA